MSLLLLLLLLSCGSAYQSCDTVKKFRCNGSMIELCDGEVWHPQYDCTAISLIDGGVAGMQCMDVADGQAECVY